MTPQEESASVGAIDGRVVLDEFLEEAKAGPWKPEPPSEDEPWEPLPSFWLTNEAGDSLLFDAIVASVLLNDALARAALSGNPETESER